MSQVTSQYGDSLISGLLAGQKMKSFKADLQYADLQRKALETEMLYKEQMQPLMRQREEVELSRAQLQRENEELARNLARRTYDSVVSEAESRASTAKSQATTAATDAEVATATKKPRIGMAESGAKQAEALAHKALLDNLSALNSGAGVASQVFTDEDYESLMDGAGVPKEPAARKLYKNWMVGQQMAAKQKFDADMSFIKQREEETAAQIAAQNGQSMYYAIQQGAELAAIKNSDPARFEVIKQSGIFKEDNPIHQLVLRIGESGVVKGSGDQTQVRNPAEEKVQEGLGSLIVKLKDELSTAEEELDQTKARVKGYYFSSGKEEVAAAQDKVNRLSKRLKDREAEINPTERKTTKGNKASTKTDNAGVPIITTKAEFDKLPPGALYRKTENGQMFQKPGN